MFANFFWSMFAMFANFFWRTSSVKEAREVKTISKFTPKNLLGETMIGRSPSLSATKTDAFSSSTQTSDGSLGREGQPAQQLLPGILDDITLDLVSPKLPWKSFYVLSSVSQGWKRAIRSGEVYDARVRAEGTETVGVLDRFSISGTSALGLYSGNDQLVHKLPPIPNFRYGIPMWSQSIALDGKIYVIGGLQDEDAVLSDYSTSIADVYVLDLARQRSWEQCKSMGCARIEFGVGVVGGKIYVLGGASFTYGQGVTVSEVYDPVYNTWNPFESMRNWRASHQVSTIGEELLIHGGFFSPKHEMNKDFSNETDYPLADFLEIYHPCNNAWRKVTPFDRGSLVSQENVFIHEGRLHSITWRAIDVYDMDKRSWTCRYSYSHAGFSSALLAGDMLSPECLDPDNNYEQEVGEPLGLHSSVAVFDNELLAAVHWDGARHFGEALLCSIGFGTQQETIQWKKVEYSFRMKRKLWIRSLEL